MGISSFLLSPKDQTQDKPHGYILLSSVLSWTRLSSQCSLCFGGTAFSCVSKMVGERGNPGILSVGVSCGSSDLSSVPSPSFPTHSLLLRSESPQLLFLSEMIAYNGSWWLAFSCLYLAKLMAAIFCVSTFPLPFLSDLVLVLILHVHRCIKDTAPLL